MKWLAILMVVLLTLPGICIASNQLYTITDLGTLGGAYSGAYSLNDLGQVVGESNQPQYGPTVAFLWSSGVINALPTPIQGSKAYGINSSTQIVGKANEHAALWERDTIIYLDNMGGTRSEALDINSSGQIVGTLTNASGQTRAVVWDDEEATILTTDTGYAKAINENGTIAGYSSIPQLGSRAWVWSGGVRSFLGFVTASNAEDINNLGQIVGSYEHSGGNRHGYLWQNSSWVDLRPLGNDNKQECLARAINDAGQVVGTSNNAEYSGKVFAAMWETGKVTDLNSLLPSGSGWFLESASDINNLGWIVGTGYINNQSHAYLLKPVPEPSSLLALGTGFSILTTLKRRKKR